MSKKAAKSGDVLSRLTDTSKYTGAHKARFDKDGKGRGLAGRDMGNEGRITDISQIVRNKKADNTIITSSSYKAKKEVTGKSVAETKPSTPPAATHKRTSSKSPARTASKSPSASSGGSSSGSSSGRAKSPVASKRAEEAADGGADEKGKKSDIVSRLTDSSKYSGMYKARFDEKDQTKAVTGVDPSAPKKSGTVSGVATMQITKFGTQAATAKKITAWQNGDKHHKGVTLTLSKQVNSFEKLLAEATGKLTLTTGAAQKFWHVNRADQKFTRIKTLDEIKDGENYLVGGAEKIAKDKLPSLLFEAK